MQTLLTYSSSLLIMVYTKVANFEPPDTFINLHQYFSILLTATILVHQPTAHVTEVISSYTFIFDLDTRANSKLSAYDCEIVIENFQLIKN